MRFVPFRFLRHGAWAKKVIQPVFCDDTKGIVAEGDNGDILGMVLLDSWTQTSVQCHFGAVTPMVWRHGLHKEAFRYVFDVCGREMMIGLIPSDNWKSRKLAEHLGFRETHRIKDALDIGVDYLIYELRKADCRYLPTMEELYGAQALAFGG